MANRLTDIKVREIAFVDKGANPGAHITLFKRATKKEGDERLPASAYAYVPDPEKPSTWKLRIDDAAHVGAAAAALGPGYRGKKVSIPRDQRAKVIARVRRAWRKFNTDKDPEDMPRVLRKRQEMVEELSEIIEKAVDFNEASDHQEMMSDLAETMDTVWQKYSALQDSIRSIMGDEEVDDKKAAVTESLKQFSDWLRGSLPEMAKRRGEDMTIEELEKALADQEEKIAEMNKRLKEADKRVAEAEAEMAKAKGKPEGDAFDKKDLPEEVRKHIEAQDAKNAELEKRATENEEKVRKLEAERETEKLLQKVKADYPNLADHDGVAKLLQNTPEDHRETLEKQLKASNESMGKAFRPAGRDGDGPDASALEEATVKARKLMADEPTRFNTLEKARSEIWKRDSELLKRYQEERRSTH